MKKCLVSFVLFISSFATVLHAENLNALYSSQKLQNSILAIPEFHEVTPDIFRGGRPSFTDLKYLKSKGIKTIINIESDKYALAKEKDYAQKLGFKWISSPMSMDVIPKDTQLKFLQDLLQDESSFPIFIHCKHGQDRTGLIIGLYRVKVQDWSPASAYKEMLKNGFHPEYKPLDKCFRDKTGYRPRSDGFQGSRI